MVKRRWYAKWLGLIMMIGVLGGCQMLSSGEEQIERAYTKTRESWGNGSFWAPEVYEWEGQYHMYYTANWKEKSSLRIGHATSDSPLGPFVDVSPEPMFDMGYAAIDGHVFTDAIGDPISIAMNMEILGNGNVTVTLTLE